MNRVRFSLAVDSQVIWILKRYLVKQSSSGERRRAKGRGLPDSPILFSRCRVELFEQSSKSVVFMHAWIPFRGRGRGRGRGPCCTLPFLLLEIKREVPFAIAHPPAFTAVCLSFVV